MAACEVVLEPDPEDVVTRWHPGRPCPGAGLQVLPGWPTAVVGAESSATPRPSANADVMIDAMSRFT